MQGPLNVGVFGARGIPSTYSGYETFLTVLLPELAARGHVLTMYCRPGQGGQSPYKGVSRVVLPAIASKELSTLSHGLVSAVRSRLAAHDVVLIVNVANAPFALLLRATGQRVVMNTDGQEWRRGKWGSAAKSYFLWSARIARLSASALVSDCKAMARIYLQQFHASSTVIPYCWPEIDDEPRPEVFEQFTVRPRQYLLVAARLNPENNVDGVVDAYVRSGCHQPLVVLGAANYRSPVERRIRQLAERHPGVRVGGHVDDRACYATLVREATGCIHAHSVGGMNPSLVEAMGCGARIVALSTPFNREVLGGAGSYFSDFDQELPAQIRQLEAGVADDAELRAAARARARERFSVAAVSDAYEDLLLRVAERPPWAATALPTLWEVG